MADEGVKNNGDEAPRQITIMREGQRQLCQALEQIAAEFLHLNKVTAAEVAGTYSFLATLSALNVNAMFAQAAAQQQHILIPKSGLPPDLRIRN